MSLRNLEVKNSQKIVRKFENAKKSVKFEKKSGKMKAAKAF